MFRTKNDERFLRDIIEVMKKDDEARRQQQKEQSEYLNKTTYAGYKPASNTTISEETLGELKKSTVASYVDKVVDPVYGMPKSKEKLKQRLAGLARAHQRNLGKAPTSEGVDEEGEQLDEWGAGQRNSSYDEPPLPYRDKHGRLHREDDEGYHKTAKADAAFNRSLERSKPAASSSGKIYHKVHFVDREHAKKEGMRWDPNVKHWYHTDAEKSKVSKFKLKEDIDMDSTQLVEALVKVSEHGKGTGAHHAVVKRDREWNEYQVHFYKDGKHMGEGPVSYHDDKKDAQSTAEHEVKRMNTMKKEDVELDEFDIDDLIEFFESDDFAKLEEGQRHILAKKLTRRFLRIDKKMGALRKSYNAPVPGSAATAAQTKTDVTRGVKQMSDDRISAMLSKLRKEELEMENTEQLDELSYDTLASYMRKRKRDLNKLAAGTHAPQGSPRAEKIEKMASKIRQAWRKRDEATESVDYSKGEQLDEAIKLGSKVKIHAPGKDYHDKVGHVGEIRDGLFKGAPKKYTVDYDHNAKTGYSKSVQLDKKNVKLHTEEVESSESEQLDELSKSTLSNYINTASGDAVVRAEISGRQTGKHAKRGMQNWEKALKRVAGITTAAKKMAKEDVDLEEATGPNHLHVQHVGGGKYKVHSVGKNWADGIKVGEHLTDTDLDDFQEMGGKLKNIEPKKKSRSLKEIAQHAQELLATDTMSEEADDSTEADQNIVVHLKKAVDTEGNHGVKFSDGSSHKVPGHVAHKVLGAMEKLKPADRLKVQSHIQQSHKNLMDVHSMVS